MCRLIGLSVALALLILLLVSILRMVLDIVIRAIAIARVRSCGWWLMGAFGGVLFQVAVVPVQWAMTQYAQYAQLDLRSCPLLLLLKY
jgi:hypothetical protein